MGEFMPALKCALKHGAREDLDIEPKTVQPQIISTSLHKRLISMQKIESVIATRRTRHPDKGEHLVLRIGAKVSDLVSKIEGNLAVLMSVLSSSHNELLTFFCER